MTRQATRDRARRAARPCNRCKHRRAPLRGGCARGIATRGIRVVHARRRRGAAGTPGVHGAATDLRWASHTVAPHWRKRALGDGTKVA
ncbi:protein of unknown function [Cupriavidus taiwanensis]|nr:protein of unknown function [Cupriavidus taiwanensis]